MNGMALPARRGFILLWAATKQPKWKEAIAERIGAIFPGEPIFDDAGRLEGSTDWRKSLRAELERARAILICLEPRVLLRCQVQPPGYDCVDELVPRELHAVLGDRTQAVAVLLFSNLEMPPHSELPPALRALAMRRAIALPPLRGGEVDFAPIEQWLKTLSTSGSAPAASRPEPKNPVPPESRPPAPAERPPFRPPPIAPLQPRPAAGPPPLRSAWFKVPPLWWMLAAGALLLVFGAAFLGARRLLNSKPPPTAAVSPGSTPGPQPGAKGAPVEISYRSVSAQQAITLSPADLASGRCVLVGEFTVSVMDEGEAMLRPIEPQLSRTIRVHAQFPRAGDLLTAGRTVQLNVASGFVVEEIRRGGDGQWNVAVRKTGTQ